MTALSARLDAVRARLDALDARERRWLIVGAAAAIAIILVGVLLPLNLRLSSAEQELAQRRRDLEWVRSVAPQVTALPRTARTAPSFAGRGRGRGGAIGRPGPGGSAEESLVALIDRVARAAGIQGTLTGSEPSGDGGLRVHFEKVGFDALTLWLGQLAQQYGVQADVATIDAAASAGLVNATLTVHSR